jgi:hypothetical protein
MMRKYVENSEGEIGQPRQHRRIRERRVLYIDDGGLGHVDHRFDNTRQLGMDSMDQERRRLNENQLDRELEEREFDKIKRELQKSKEDFMAREHIMKRSRQESMDITIITKDFIRAQNPLLVEESMSNSSYLPERYSVNNRGSVMNRLTTRNQIDRQGFENSVNSGSQFSERYNVDGRYSSHRNTSGNSSNAQNFNSRYVFDFLIFRNNIFFNSNRDTNTGQMRIDPGE